MIVVGMFAFGGKSWAGGRNYLFNLLTAIRDYAGHDVCIVLFLDPSSDLFSISELDAFEGRLKIVKTRVNSRGIYRFFRYLLSFVFGFDLVSYLLFKAHGVHVAFVHGDWFGRNFSFPQICWIPDLQHRLMPSMFSRLNRFTRDFIYRTYYSHAAAIVLSSQSSRDNFEKFYGQRHNVFVARFAVQTRGVLPSKATSLLIFNRLIVAGSFFFLPNQFWRHKNHRVVIDALIIAQSMGQEIFVVSTGLAFDPRFPNYAKELLSDVKDLGLEHSFIFLGFVEKENLDWLLLNSLALINPSFCEGWSTTVEEAKSFGVPLILSDIDVHREQAPGSIFFDPSDSRSLAALLGDFSPTDRSAYDVSRAREKNEFSRRDFALGLSGVFKEVFRDGR